MDIILSPTSVYIEALMYHVLADKLKEHLVKQCKRIFSLSRILHVDSYNQSLMLQCF
jgi:hypothetical protein